MVEEFMEENPEFFRNGKEAIVIKDLSGKWEYKRQRLNSKKTKPQNIPINKFLGERQKGQSVVSQNLEQKVIKDSLQVSYRKSEAQNHEILKKETIRRRLIQKGQKAENLEKTKKESLIISEEKTKDATKEGSYKKSRGSKVRSILGKIFGWERLYLMVDGVGVQGQGKGWEGTKECKVGTILSQKGAEIKEIGSFCTWQRLPGFKRILMVTMLFAIGLAGIYSEIIIISDGAKWIRNLRKWIPCLNSATWILDWFHIKDRLEKMLRELEIEREGNIGKYLRTLLWKGKVDEVLTAIDLLPTSKIEAKKEKQESAKASLITYIKNQREGLVNYEKYQMKGYFVGSGYVEKTNDTLVKNRMVRQKRMRWGRFGGEAMMQLLTAMMNDRLDEVFT